MARRLTNQAFVRDVMVRSEFGVLAEAFVIEAIRRYAVECAKADPAAVDSPFLSGEAWVGVAKEIEAKVKEQYR